MSALQAKIDGHLTLVRRERYSRLSLILRSEVRRKDDEFQRKSFAQIREEFPAIVNRGDKMIEEYTNNSIRIRREMDNANKKMNDLRYSFKIMKGIEKQITRMAKL